MPRFRRILAPTDFSSNGSHAIAYACDLAKQNEAELHVLNVHHGKFDEGLRQAHLEKLHRLIDAASELELKTVTHVEFGHPAQCIREYAGEKKMDAIVMGTHGRSGLVHLAMGSVAEQVIRDAPCPVTVLGPEDGQNATLNHAIDIIEPLIGEGTELEEEDGHALFACELVKQLRIPTTTAILMVDQLIEKRWLSWSQGKWHFVEGIEFLDALETPFNRESSHENQAIDLVKRAMKLRATDVHIDPVNDREYQVRMRIDGVLQKYCELDRAVGSHLVGQLKTLAQLNIADPFSPMEGRLRLPTTLRNTEVRLSTVPVIEGQAAALRVLDSDQIFRPLDLLGLGQESLHAVQQMVQADGGLILVTGPTGSGKTTTVYSMLESIDHRAKNIVSIEDPVEFSAPFVRQISVDLKNGLTMATGLKTVLRMDPDVIFIGEIRDSETAKIAIQAATSGKLVFATMHTRDVASSVQALLDFGVDFRSVANQLSGVINQRLARRLCPQCREPVQVDEEWADMFRAYRVNIPDQLFECSGCVTCQHRGFRGRIGIFECAALSEDFFKRAQTSTTVDELREHLVRSGVVSLAQDALSKAAEGLTGIREAVNVQWPVARPLEVELATACLSGGGS